ncbi:MAG: 3-phosphoglycerate dehydrogenase family protein [Spirochaetia bacterium]|nr:3-phosphoglycerate dehydrogenase family protein [Spirochaetia bacterium]
MYKIQTLNKISVAGLSLLDRDKYETASEMANPDGIILRSFKMHDMELPASLLAVARAGAGVNNIPIDKCTEKGIVVFNTPGANANSVKELVIASMFIASRNIPAAIDWCKTLADKGDEVPQLVEKGKGQFVGHELKGKTLGVIGLGAIGVMVANSAAALGMNVIGFDPYISVDAAWGLSREIRKAISLDTLIAESDYITVHVPLTDGTKGMFNADKFAIMKKGTVLLNFARGGLVKNDDLKAAIEAGIISKYMTDFPDAELINMNNVIAIPHLGASSEEAEDNCAAMAATELKDYLEFGNIKNSVNFPNCEMPYTGRKRLTIINKDIPNVIGQLSTIMASEKINIAEYINKNKNGYAYNIVEIDSKCDVSDEMLQRVITKLESAEGVISVRLI